MQHITALYEHEAPNGEGMCVPDAVQHERAPARNRRLTADLPPTRSGESDPNSRCLAPCDLAGDGFASADDKSERVGNVLLALHFQAGPGRGEVRNRAINDVEIAVQQDDFPAF
jgi:hypothetical protein